MSSKLNQMNTRYHAKKRIEILDRLLDKAIDQFKPEHVIRKLQINLQMAKKAYNKLSFR